MTIFYSRSTGQFCHPLLVYPDGGLPDDVIEISDELHQALIENRANGGTIGHEKDGTPFPVSPLPLSFADMQDRYLRQVKAICAQHILTQVPAWKQSNDNATLALVSTIDPAARTAVQVADLEASITNRATIDTLRACCTTLVALIEAAMSIDELTKINLDDDAHWSVK